ncbi:CheR family methyltransferase [Celeribacter neptunius]|uniref:Chemotaxis protein methyltransferase n=1 Tax=Celeribacter neptunius TaxID=588602 RepID=A0A1I3LRF9_9RHOB|nr:protein-glutamate O-methyltransferase [Celeribacter neptunius]SFI87374.1 chemotaxis protein methyltransferase CheR [Celeribacter neptunius]
MSELSPITGRPKIVSDISAQAFARIAQIAQREAGIMLAEAKVSMVKSRLTRRLRVLEMANFDDYLDYLEHSGDPKELECFISALTTNVSHFFRENHHFENLATNVVPLLRQKLAAGGKVRIWSAGCSNGQEPYSIAITLLDKAPDLAQKDVRILATDIDPEVIAHAKRGEYIGSLTTGLTDDIISRHFTRSERDGEIVLTAKPEIKKLVSFNQLNLHADWPMKLKFDVIFCRNVVIYFDEPTQTKLFRRFADILEPGGILMLGHSERLNENVSPLFESSGVTTYRTRPNINKPSPAPTGALESKGKI